VSATERDMITQVGAINNLYGRTEVEKAEERGKLIIESLMDLTPFLTVKSCVGTAI